MSSISYEEPYLVGGGFFKVRLYVLCFFAYSLPIATPDAIFGHIYEGLSQ